MTPEEKKRKEAEAKRTSGAIAWSSTDYSTSSAPASVDDSSDDCNATSVADSDCGGYAGGGFDSSSSSFDSDSSSFDSSSGSFD